MHWMHWRASAVSAWVRSRDQVSEASGVQLGLPVLCPLLGALRPGPVDGLGHVSQMLLGVLDVDDLDGVGKLLVGQVPDPGGAVAEDDLSSGGDEAAPLRLAMGALGEGSRLRVGVAAGRALNGGVVADRPRVTARPALGVAPFGRPRRRQLDLAGLGGAVGLLAAAPGDLRLRAVIPVRCSRSRIKRLPTQPTDPQAERPERHSRPHRSP